MACKHYIPICIFFGLAACATKVTDFRKVINNTTFSDVHRNPKVVANEYFEFKNSAFTYTETRKEFEDNYFRKNSYKGIYYIIKDSLYLTVQEALFCDKEVLGMNKIVRPKKGAPAPDPDKCTYSYYDIQLLKSRKLIDRKTIKMPNKYRIVKNTSTTKIIGIGKYKGKVYEAKEPLTY